MGATFEQKGTAGLVTLAGTLTAANVDSFREQFTGWWRSVPETRNVVVDLGALDFLDSSGLGTLIALLKRVSERGGDMKIARLQKKVRMVFEITRAYKVFEIFDNVEDAAKVCG